MAWIGPVIGAVASAALSGSGEGGDGLNAGAASAAQMNAEIGRQQWGFAKENYLPLEGDLIADVTGYKFVNKTTTTPGPRRWVQPVGRTLGGPGGGYEQTPGHWEESAPVTTNRREAIKVGEPIGSPADQELYAGKANADVTQSFDRARREGEAGFRAAGINEADPRFTSANSSLGLSEAATRASMMNTAREGRVKERYAKLYQLAGLGRGMVTGAQTGLSNASSQLGTLGFNADRTEAVDAGNRAYALAPVTNAIGEGVSKWYNSPKSSDKLYNNTDYGASFNSGNGNFSSRMARGGLVKKKKMLYASGGLLKGPGTETSDSIPIDASDGEYVVNAEAVRRVGTDKLDRINALGLQRRMD